MALTEHQLQRMVNAARARVEALSNAELLVRYEDALTGGKAFIESLKGAPWIVGAPRDPQSLVYQMAYGNAQDTYRFTRSALLVGSPLRLRVRKNSRVTVEAPTPEVFLGAVERIAVMDEAIRRKWGWDTTCPP